MATTTRRVLTTLLISLLALAHSRSEDYDEDELSNFLQLLDKIASQDGIDRKSEEYPSEEEYSDDEADEDDDRELSLEDRSLSRSRLNRKQRPVLCEVVKTQHEFREHGYTFKPSTYSSLECRNADVDPFNFSGNKTREFCYLRRNRDWFSHRGCYTSHKQVPIFKRLHNSTEWIPVAKHVNVGCNCLLGFKYHD